MPLTPSMPNPGKILSPNKPFRRLPAILWLGMAGAVCLVVYGFIFTGSAFLFTFIDIPKYDLRLMVEGEPSLLWLYRIGFLVLAAMYILGGWSAAHSQGWKAWVIVLGAAFLSAGTLIFLYPFDASDIFDYIIHGRMLALYGANPYQATAVAYPLDPIYPYVGWVKSTSPYGPFWLQLSALTARFAGNTVVGNVIAFKLLDGVFYCISVGFVAAILHNQNPKRTLAGVWLFACNPLVLYETFGHGHNDITLTACLLGSVWFMVGRRYTLTVLALVAGALFKYVSLLVLPAAVLFALINHNNWKAKLRYLGVTGLSCLVLIVFAYQPFWAGWKTIDLTTRVYLYTTSLPTIIQTQFRDTFGITPLSQAISLVAAILTLLVSVFITWRLIREKSWMSYPKAALAILLFYLLVTCLWFQQWYVVWLVGLVVLLPLSGLTLIGYLLSFWVMTKVLVFAPPLLWIRPLPTVQYREFWLSVGVMGLPWLVSLIVLVRYGINEVRALTHIKVPKS
ncbi:MAG: hypothetical protein WCF08_04220 [Anaerolineaceae bacterium]